MRLVLVLVAVGACSARPAVIGEQRWDVTLADGSDSALTSVAFVGDDVVVAGWERVANTTTAFVSGLNGATGAIAWTVRLEGRYTWISKLDVDLDGNIDVCGIYEGTADFGGTVLEQPPGVGGEVMFVASYDSNGKLRWAHPLATEAGGELLDIAVGSDGDIAVTGWLVGTLGSNTTHDHDAFAAELDPEGTLRWSFIAPAPGPQFGEGIAVTADGGVVAGLPPSAVALSPTGTELWTRPFPPLGPNAIAVEHRGDVVLAGVDATEAAEVARIDPLGSTMSTFSPPAEMAPLALAVGPDDTVFVAGGGLVAFDRDGALLDGRPAGGLDVDVADDGTIVLATKTSVTLLDAP